MAILFCFLIPISADLKFQLRRISHPSIWNYVLLHFQVFAGLVTHLQYLTGQDIITSIIFCRMGHYTVHYILQDRTLDLAGRDIIPSIIFCRVGHYTFHYILQGGHYTLQGGTLYLAMQDIILCRAGNYTWQGGTLYLAVRDIIPCRAGHYTFH